MLTCDVRLSTSRSARAWRRCESLIEVSSGLRRPERPGPVRIEVAAKADVAFLAGMNRRLIEDERDPNPMTVCELAERMEGFLSGGYTAYLARQADRVVSYVLYRDDGATYYMRHLYVERGYRRRGIASELLDWRFANVWTDKPVRLDVLAHNQNAIAFYTVYGFEVGCLRMEKRPPSDP